MANIDGHKVKYATIGTTVQKVEFNPPVRFLDIALMGDESVYFKVNGDDLTGVSDTSANFLNESVRTVTIEKAYEVQKITLVAAADTVVQWDTP